MKIKPLFDKVVVKPLEKDKESKGGILLAVKDDDKTQFAKVVEIGEGNLPDGTKQEMKIKIGDKVLYAKYSGTEITLDAEKFLIIRQSDILAIVE